MSYRIYTLLVALVIFGVPAIAKAGLFQVDYSNIIVSTLEDFETSVGTLGSNESFNGFSASVDVGSFVVDASSPPICGGAGSTACLYTPSSTFNVPTFTGFGVGTTSFGFELSALTDTNVFEVTIVGASGTAVTTVTGDGVYGFGDGNGLTSITLRNLGDSSGTGNFGIDNVITGVALQENAITDRLPALPEAVPLPTAALLLLTMLVPVSCLRRR